MLDGVVLQKQQVQFVDQGGHVDVVLKGACFKFATSQNNLFIKREYLILRDNCSIIVTSSVLFNLLRRVSLIEMTGLLLLLLLLQMRVHARLR